MLVNKNPQRLLTFTTLQFSSSMNVFKPDSVDVISFSAKYIQVPKPLWLFIKLPLLISTRHYGVHCPKRFPFKSKYLPPDSSWNIFGDKPSCGYTERLSTVTPLLYFAFSASVSAANGPNQHRLQIYTKSKIELFTQKILCE